MIKSKFLTRKISSLAFIFFNIIVLTSSSYGQSTMNNRDKQSWMLYPFKKNESLFPILKNDTTSFFCPVTKKQVKWQETFVFNPAAIVKNGKVYLLFRGEDKIGKFGGTSRLGIAESSDGLYFTVIF
jgi:predicted GH43/DUF377 family glycosyl hydrolase